MGHKTRKIVRRIIMAGNLLVIIIMLSVGHIDRLNPVNHPMLANLGLGFPILLVLNTGFLLIWIFFRRRLIWLPILGFLLCFGPIRKYIPFNLPKEKPHGSLKILSYNVFLFAPWNIPDGEPNPIIEYIIRSKADIVCLQERCTTSFSNPLSILRHNHKTCNANRVFDASEPLSNHQKRNYSFQFQRKYDRSLSAQC